VVRVFSRVSRWSERSQQVVKVVGVVIVTILTGAVGLQIAEPKAVKGFSDALWWSLVTMSTVGYGDIVPVTGQGRIVGALLILFGFGVFGYVAGFVADMLRSKDDRTTVLLHRIDDRLAHLEERLGEGESTKDGEET